MTKLGMGLFFLILLACGLSYSLITLNLPTELNQHLCQLMGYWLGCYGLAGIGMGLPCSILATVMGWVQLLLLINGNIPPHLAREGFLTVFQILLHKI